MHRPWIRPPLHAIAARFFRALWLTFLSALLVFALGFSLYRSAGTTVVLLVRAASEDTAIIADPPISPEGEERGNDWRTCSGKTARGLMPFT